MRTLILLRHAKSSWNDASLDDHDRPLAPRGQRAAPAMGRWMAREGVVPDLVLCSSAVRARETWSLVAAELDPTPPVNLEPEIYEASPSGLLRIVRQAPDQAERLLLVGHNPGFHDLARRLAGNSATGKDAKRLRKKLPTGAVVALEMEIASWNDIVPDAARLAHFMRPKDLPEAEEREL